MKGLPNQSNPTLKKQTNQTSISLIDSNTIIFTVSKTHF